MPSHFVQNESGAMNVIPFDKKLFPIIQRRIVEARKLQGYTPLRFALCA